MVSVTKNAPAQVALLVEAHRFVHPSAILNLLVCPRVMEARIRLVVLLHCVAKKPCIASCQVVLRPAVSVLPVVVVPVANQRVSPLTNVWLCTPTAPRMVSVCRKQLVLWDKVVVGQHNCVASQVLPVHCFLLVQPSELV